MTPHAPPELSDLYRAFVKRVAFRKPTIVRITRTVDARVHRQQQPRVSVFEFRFHGDGLRGIVDMQRVAYNLISLPQT